MTVWVKGKPTAFSQIRVYVQTEVCLFANNLGILLIECAVSDNRECILRNGSRFLKLSGNNKIKL